MTGNKRPLSDGKEAADESVELQRAGDADGKWDPGPLVSVGGKVDASALERAIAEAGAEGEDSRAVRTVRFRLLRDLDKRLDRYLTDRITFMSRNQLQKLIDEGGVKVNGRVPKSSTRLNAGDLVEVVVPPPPPTEIQPEDIPLEVLFEDEHLIVINKSPDILVHPARSHNRGTMVNALAFHFRNRSRLGGALSSVGTEFARPGVVHRLDRNTSGVIVFAKTEEAHWKLGHSFEHRRVDKRYLAIVEGNVEPDMDVIDLPLGPHPSREKGYREKYVVRHDELGKPSVTIYRVRERYRLDASVPGVLPAPSAPAPAPGWSAPSSPGRPITPAAAVTSTRHGDVRVYSLVELELRTGRTHQIRVHLSHLGWPIVGDDMYGGRVYRLVTSEARSECSDRPSNQGNAGAAGDEVTRQALHACELGFTHPISGEKMRFTAPLRGELSALVHDLRARAGPRLETPGVPGATIDLARAIP